MNTPHDKIPRNNSDLVILERAVEALTGKNADALRQQTISERRKELEAAHHQKMQFVSHFPFIGRGNVMRDRVMNHEKVEHLLLESETFSAR